MSQVLSALQAALPVLLAVLPSLVVAMTKYPTADGVISTVLKVLNMLSVLVHSDSPGTVKMPLTMSKDPHGLQKPGTGPVGLASIAILTAGSLLLASCACSNPSNAGKWYCKAETALIDCSVSSAQPAIQAAMADVTAAVSGNAIDWVALARAEASYGIGIVACVLQKLDAANAVPHARVQEYFLAKKLHIKK